MLENIRNSSQSLGIKIALGVIILVFVFWGIGSFTNTSSIVAKVNDVEISEQDFIIAYNQQYERIRAMLPEITEEQLKQMQFPQLVFESLVTQALLESEANRTGIDVTPLELFEVIATFPFVQDAQGKFDPQKYLAALEQAGQNPRAFEDGLKKEMREGKFRAILAQFAHISEEQAKLFFDYQFEEREFDAFFVAAENFIDKVEPSEEDLQNMYTLREAEFSLPASLGLQFIEISPEILAKPENISQAEIDAEYAKNPQMYDIPENVTASHILILLNETATAQDEEKAMNTIQEIQAKLEKGEDFKELAKVYSQDPGSAPNGGELGSFTRGQMVEEFETAAFATEINSVSAPIRSQFGYHLIFVEDKEEAHAPAKDELNKEISNKLALEKAQGEIQSLLDSLLVQLHANENNADILNNLANTNNLKVVSSPILSLNEFADTFGISNTDMQMLTALEEGNIAPSAISTNNGFIIAKVTDNLPDRVMPFEEVKPVLTQLAKRELAHEEALKQANLMLESVDSISRAPSTYIMGRDGIFELGDSVELAETLFAADMDNTWFDSAFALANGYVIAKPKSIIPAQDSLWENMKDAQLAELLTARENLFYAVYMQELRENAEIEILNPLYFE